MLSTSILNIIISIISILPAQPRTGETLFKMMHRIYFGVWHNTLTFDQKTEIYKNDSMTIQYWHECLKFPDKLRIDIQPYDKGSTIIFKNDSTYNIKNGRLSSASNHGNELIFLLGGMYFYPVDSSIKKLVSLGFNINKFTESTWKGRSVYILGTTINGEHVNQLWFDKKNLYLVRMLKYDKDTFEGIFENQIRINNSWAETKASFYRNNKLLQVETYSNIKVHILNEKIYDPFKIVSFSDIYN